MEKDEAIEIIRKNFPKVGFGNSQFEKALRTLAPELQESEDEAIRKKLIDLFKQGEICIYGEFDNVLFIKWLEKQEKLEQNKWHKVADGDLPKENGCYLIVYKEKTFIYELAYYEDGNWEISKWKNVIAWCEFYRYVE